MRFAIKTCQKCIDFEILTQQSKLWSNQRSLRRRGAFIFQTNLLTSVTLRLILCKSVCATRLQGCFYRYKYTMCGILTYDLVWCHMVRCVCVTNTQCLCVCENQHLAIWAAIASTIFLNSFGLKLRWAEHYYLFANACVKAECICLILLSVNGVDVQDVEMRRVSPLGGRCAPVQTANNQQMVLAASQYTITTHITTLLTHLYNSKHKDATMTKY